MSGVHQSGGGGGGGAKPPVDHLVGAGMLATAVAETVGAATNAASSTVAARVAFISKR